MFLATWIFSSYSRIVGAREKEAMKLKTICTFNSPLGPVSVVESEGALVEVLFGIPEKSEAKTGTSPLLQEAEKQLREYFDGVRTQFDLPLQPEGTEFQKKVWQALLSIPYGETRTYKEVAELVGNVNATRAVGGANNKNPLGIVVPCHRVIGANGKMVGYAGGVEFKEYLLQLEKSHKL